MRKVSTPAPASLLWYDGFIISFVVPLIELLRFLLGYFGLLPSENVSEHQ